MDEAFDGPDAVVEFALRLCAFLRQNGLVLGTQQSMACVQAIRLLVVTEPRRLLNVCALTLVNRREDLHHLRRLFAIFLSRYRAQADTELPAPEPDDRRTVTVTRRVFAGGDDAADDDSEDSAATAGYSTREVDQQQDFRFLEQRDYPAVVAELARIARTYATIARRKKKPARQGELVDLRASLRQSVKFDGEVFDWRYRTRLRTHTRLAVVLDVSGSMEIYSTFLLNFLYLLHQHRCLHLEVFAFSTDLQRLTPYLRQKTFADMLESMSRHFNGWAGGTRIGYAIESLNADYAAAVTNKTAVVVMSDGWDTGEPQLLDRAMARLANRARAIIWLNPLKGDANYEALATGMATARPYCTEFISGHSLASLAAFARLVTA